MGLLDFGKRVLGRFGGNADSSDQNTTNLAFVLLSRPELPKAEDVVRSWVALGTGPPNLRVRDDGEEVSYECLVFEVDPDCGAFVMLMPIPVPENEADNAAQFSVSSLGTGWVLPPHQAHLVVTFQSSEPKLQSLLLFTLFVAAVSQASPTVGVYCGEAGATHDPKFFVEAAQPGTVGTQIMLWNGISVAREPDGRVSLLSMGMKQLDLPDLWLIAPKESQPLPWLFDLLSYVANRGEALPDGDTIGRTEEEKIPVRYVKSPVDESTTVCRIEVK